MAAAAVGSILRWGLALAAGYVIRAGVWTDANASVYVEAATLALISLGWSQWQHFLLRRKLVVALSVHGPTSEAHVDQVIAAGGTLPSVTTRPEVVPTAGTGPDARQ
jgi:hypothetical protein